MPRRNKNAGPREGKFSTTDADYGYGGPPALSRRCPVDDCLATFAADTKADLAAAVTDHKQNAHGEEE